MFQISHVPRYRALTALSCLALLVLGGCANRTGVVEFQTYAATFQESQFASDTMFDQIAAAERVVESTARLNPGGLGVDPTFRVEDAEVFSDISDPPLIGQYRHAMAAIGSYNLLMLGFATGRGFQESIGEYQTFVTEIGNTTQALNENSQIARELIPFADILSTAANLALAGQSREVFREQVLSSHEAVIGLLEKMRDGAPVLFTNLTFKIQNDILDAISRGQSPAAAQRKHEEARVLVSNWVVMMNRNIDALNTVKQAVENPGQGLSVAGATQDLIEFRTAVEAVRKQLAAMNAQ